LLVLGHSNSKDISIHTVTFSTFKPSVSLRVKLLPMSRGLYTLVFANTKRSQWETIVVGYINPHHSVGTFSTMPRFSKTGSKSGDYACACGVPECSKQPELQVMSFSSGVLMFAVHSKLFTINNMCQVRVVK
jgi:hypothetical protein